MLNKEKTSPEVGNAIHEVLLAREVETPILKNREKVTDYGLQKTFIENAFRMIMGQKGLGLDLNDDSLSETPSRVAKMFLNELFWGLDYNNFPKITTIENKMHYDSILVERGIKVHSVCEHHFVPIIGEAIVAYLPHKKVIGLSKINRVVEFFSRRPQVQERLVEQIYYALSHVLETENVAVMIRAEHLCVKLRGVEDINSDTITTKLGGAFIEEGPLRNEFYHAVEYGKIH